MEQTTTAAIGGARTLAELLLARAQDQPDRLGYSFLADGETTEFALTYAETDRRARAIAASIREAGGRPGARVMLLLPPGLDYVTAFFGCLYAGVVAVPVYPPDPFQLQRTLPRLLAIVCDADPAVALTTSSLLSYLDQVTEVAPGLGAMQWVAVDAVPDPVAGAGDPAVVDPGAVALLQYTSGSTAAPRGVMLSHGNLLHNLRLIRRFFRTSADTRALVWLPPYHDMGLIGGLLQPLYAGCPVTLMSPLHFLQQPMRWLRAIDRLRVTASGGPNFAYEMCVRKADPDQLAQLDLSAWQVAFNGAEPIRPETLERFARTFSPTGFRADAFLNCYGLAEATLIVSGAGGRSASAPEPGPTAPPVVAIDRAALGRNVAARPGEGPVVRLASCGHGAADQRIEIVDPATSELCAPRRVGEVWVSGPSVAQGYWRNPDETDREFRARIAGRDEEGPFLRTGDLGFFHDGQLVVTGRLKDLIIVRGQNHYPQDIELTAERVDPVLRTGCTAAFQVPGDGSDDRLVLVHEVRRSSDPVDVPAVAARVRQAVAQDHGLQVHAVILIRAGGLPKTSSGKVQRRLCRARFLSGELPEVGRHEAVSGPIGDAPAGVEQVFAATREQRGALLESYLRGQIAALIDVDPADLDRREPLLAAGLDSLAVVQLKHRLETDLTVDLSLTALLDGATLSDVVDQLAGQVAEPAVVRARPAATARAQVAAVERVAPMSPSQRWIWLVQQLEPESTVYTIAVALRLVGAVDLPALRRALDALVARHPVLRTTFTVRDGEAVQVVHPRGQAAFREHDVPDRDQDALTRLLTAAARRPFDLASKPLLRADLYRHPGGEVLLLAMPHIITDFWSSTILARELGAYYTAYAAGRELTLPPPRATYLDVCEWRRSVLGDPATAEDLDRYWGKQLGDHVPRLALPAVGEARSARGGVRSFSLSESLARRLRVRAASEKVTMYVLLLAAFESLLHRTTGQPDLVVGAALAGRTRPEFAEVVGCCTVSVMIRSRAAEDEPFRALLSRTKDQVIGALEHQDYPMMVLGERHKLDRRGSLVDVLFAFNQSPQHGDDLAALVTVGPPGVPRSLGSLEVETFSLPLEAGELPLEVVVAEVGGLPYGLLRYRAGVLDEAAADRLVEQFIAVLEQVAVEPDVPLGELLPAVPAGSREP